jgi:hypothetical protein
MWMHNGPLQPSASVWPVDLRETFPPRVTILIPEDTGISPALAAQTLADDMLAALNSQTPSNRLALLIQNFAHSKIAPETNESAVCINWLRVALVRQSDAVTPPITWPNTDPTVAVSRDPRLQPWCSYAKGEMRGWLDEMFEAYDVLLTTPQYAALQGVSLSRLHMDMENGLWGDTTTDALWPNYAEIMLRVTQDATSGNRWSAQPLPGFAGVQTLDTVYADEINDFNAFLNPVTGGTNCTLPRACGCSDEAAGCLKFATDWPGNTAAQLELRYLDNSVFVAANSGRNRKYVQWYQWVLSRAHQGIIEEVLFDAFTDRWSTIQCTNYGWSYADGRTQNFDYQNVRVTNCNVGSGRTEVSRSFQRGGPDRGQLGAMGRSNTAHVEVNGRWGQAGHPERTSVMQDACVPVIYDVDINHGQNPNTGDAEPSYNEYLPGRP